MCNNNYTFCFRTSLRSVVQSSCTPSVLVCTSPSTTMALLRAPTTHRITAVSLLHFCLSNLNDSGCNSEAVQYVLILYLLDCMPPSIIRPLPSWGGEVPAQDFISYTHPTMSRRSSRAVCSSRSRLEVAIVWWWAR